MRRVLVAAVCLALVPACSSPSEDQARPTGVTVFEGARLITGDGSAPIENSAFIVENNQFTQVGRRGEVQVPAGAARVDLTGKTVMPTMVDLHGHVGFQNVAEGTMSKETFTRDESDRSPGASRVQRGRRRHRRRRPDQPFRPARRPDELGRRAVAGAGRNRSRCGAVSDGGSWDRLAGIRCARPPLQNRRVLSGLDGRRGSSGRSRLCRHEAGVHQDLGGRPRRNQEDADAASLSSDCRRGAQVQRSRGRP